MISLAIGGCVAEVDLDGEASVDGDQPDTATAEQAVTQTLYDVRGFGGNLFAETFNYITTASCSPGFHRAGATTRWTSQMGGHCNVIGWVTPSNPLDCRALVQAHTAGGWFGGTCETFVTEESLQGSFGYSAAATSSAQVNTANRSITLHPGQTLTIGTCGVAGASVSGDSYLRLFSAGGGQLAFNDDECGGYGSKIVYTAGSFGAVQIRAGCYLGTACSGTVAWTIQ